MKAGYHGFSTNLANWRFHGHHESPARSHRSLEKLATVSGAIRLYAQIINPIGVRTSVVEIIEAARFPLRSSPQRRNGLPGWIKNSPLPRLWCSAKLVLAGLGRNQHTSFLLVSKPAVWAIVTHEMEDGR
jgi:hypothetical protein